jgi:hypothetical protein
LRIDHLPWPGGSRGLTMRRSLRARPARSRVTRINPGPGRGGQEAVDGGERVANVQVPPTLRDLGWAAGTECDERVKRAVVGTAPNAESGAGGRCDARQGWGVQNCLVLAVPHQAGKECESTEAVRQIAQAWLVKIGTVDNRQHLTPRIAASLAGRRQRPSARPQPGAPKPPRRCRQRFLAFLPGLEHGLGALRRSGPRRHRARRRAGAAAGTPPPQQPVVLVEHGGELAGEGCARCS